MRKIQHEQMQVGEIDIGSVTIEIDNRDEIPQLLRGLQQLYVNKVLRSQIFKVLMKLLPKEVDKDNGRNGMTLWSIFVLGSIRLNCNWDYDKLQEIANNHVTLRQMLGHGILDLEKRYPRQTLCDNLRLFTPEILDSINRIVIKEGHKVLGIAEDEKLHARCDSFVVETDVHYPTDINLLWDATRKVLQIGYRLAEEYEIEGWRQTPHNLVVTKKLFRQVQRLREKDNDSQKCISTTDLYLQTAQNFFDRAENCFILEKYNKGFQ